MMRHISRRISSIFKGSKTGELGVTTHVKEGDLRKRGGNSERVTRIRECGRKTELLDFLSP